MTRPVTIVFPYGCPRSGSTLIQQIMHAGEGYLCQKIGEYSPLHPAQSADGLILLAELLGSNLIVFVRIERKPEEIINSYYVGMNNIDDQKDATILRARADLPTRVVRDIARERVWSEIQADWLNKNLYANNPLPQGFFSFHYDDFRDESIWIPKLRSLCEALPLPDRNFSLLSDYIKATFLKVSVRAGEFSLVKAGKAVNRAPADFIADLMGSLDAAIDSARKEAAANAIRKHTWDRIQE